MERYRGFSSDCSSLNLYAWRAVYNSSFCVDGDYLLIRYTNGGESTFLFPLGGDDPAGEIDRLCAWQRERGCRSLRLIAARGQEKLLPAGFTVREERDLFDYVCSAPALVACEGHLYRHFRNHISAFERCGQPDYRTVTDDDREDFMQVVSDCVTQSPEADAATELMVAREMLGLSHIIPQTGLLVYLEDKPVGAILGSLPHPGLLDIHLRHARREYPGIYDALTHKFIATVLEQYRIEHVNFEEDMGIEGLRTSKLRIPPDFLWEKYVCTRQL